MEIYVAILYKQNLKIIDQNWWHALKLEIWKSQHQFLSVVNNSDVKTWQLPLKDETISIEIAHKQAEEKKDTIEHPKCKTCFSTGDTQLLVTLKAHRIFHRMSGHVCSIFPKKKNYFFDKDIRATVGDTWRVSPTVFYKNFIKLYFGNSISNSEISYKSSWRLVKFQYQ